MSEYQYYEFQAIDRPLTEKEQSYISSLSRRADLSAYHAIFTYSFSDFPADPISILQNYFDAMLYVTNWGTKQLAFRLPRSVVDPEMIEPYCFEDIISASVAKRDIILDINVQDEDNGWVEGEGWLPSLALLRQDLLRGDFRALYLAWLKAISFEQDIEDVEEQIEPPVPANLQTLSAPLKTFIELFEVDEDLIAVASESSPQNDDVVEHVEELIATLSERERDEFLVKLAKGEANVEAQLMRKLRGLSSNKLKASKEPMPRMRSVTELLAAAREKTKQRKEKQRQEAERARILRLKKLKDMEPQVWEEIFALIEKKQSKAYDEAIKLLVELHELANYLGEPDKFKDRVTAIYEKYPNRPGLKSRLQEAKLLNRGKV